MTKSAFMNELSAALAAVDTKSHDEILADLNEHFIEGIAQGLSEEEICRGLGQPGTIAAQVLEEIGPRVQYTPPPPQGNLSDDRLSFSAVSNLNIVVDVSSVRLLPSPDSQFHVTFANNDNKRVVCKAEVTSGTLHVSVETVRRMFVFSFGASVGVETTVYIPAGFLGEIRIRSAAGGVAIKDTNGQLDLDTTAGGIAIKGHKCDKVRLRSAVGGINADFTGGRIDDVDINTDAGSIDFSASETGRMRVVSSAGGVNVKVVRICGNTSISSSAGGVDLTAYEVAGDINLETSAGSVRAQLPYDVNCRIRADKPSIGKLKNELVGNPNSPHVLRASSSIGSIKLTILR